MLWSQEWQEEDREKNMSPEETTMREVSRMASSIMNGLKFTYDTPGMNRTGTMAVLDTQVWMGEEAREEGIPEEILEESEHPRMKTGELKRVVLFRFYQKPMTDRTANRKTSAQPEGMKVSTVAGEIIRRCKNTSRDLPKEALEETLKEYMKDLEDGGYGVKWREEVLHDSMKGYIRMWREEVAGKGRICRPGKATTTLRRWKKLAGARNWFQPGGKTEKGSTERKDRKERKDPKEKKKDKEPQRVESVLFVPYTRNSELKKEMQKMEDGTIRRELTGKIRVVERMGKNIKELVCRMSPWKKDKCVRTCCEPCIARGGACKEKNVVYRIVCMDCLEDGKDTQYQGETGRTFWDRYREYRVSLETRKGASCVMKHWQEHHPEKETPPNYVYKVIQEAKLHLRDRSGRHWL